MNKEIKRRDFIKKTTLATAGLTLAASSFTAKSYARIIGSNSRLNFGVLGVRSRGLGLIGGILENKNTLVSHICDVDQRYLTKASKEVVSQQKEKPQWNTDVRKMLESKDIDVIAIATPDHWHTPMSIMGLQAGKHVYVEKPCSHNPHEGEMLIKAQQKYGKLVQMGNQQRSSPHSIKIIRLIHEGLIGEPYMAKAIYSSNRGDMGIGKVVPVPDYLNWDLWQGPAPRRAYKDNIHPYNWHWLSHYGTGEALNNGTHEVDVCRWALGVDYPNKINASGGRYHFKDDWEFPDTLITNFVYDNKMISWEGKSCNGKHFAGGRGAIIFGTKGTVKITRGGYQLFNSGNKLIEDYKKGEEVSTNDLQSRDLMTALHFQNLMNGIKDGEKLHAPIADANIGVTMLQLSNISWKVNRELHLNTKNGHIFNDDEASSMRQREYEPGWELKI